MAKTATKTAGLKVNQAYISNPYQVLLDSFRTVTAVSFSTFWAFVVVGVLSFVLGFLLIASVAYSFQFELSTFWAVLVVAALIIWGIILLASFTKYALETAKAKPITFSQALSAGYQKAAGYVGLTLLTVLIVVGGLVLLIVPGLIFMYWLSLSPYIYIDQEVTITEAMRRSKQLVSKQPAEIFGLMAAGISLSVFGIIPLLGIVFGIFFNVVWYVAWSYRYLSAQRLADKKLSKPATNRANYWAILLALAALILMSVLDAAS